MLQDSAANGASAKDLRRRARGFFARVLHEGEIVGVEICELDVLQRDDDVG